MALILTFWARRHWSHHNSDRGSQAIGREKRVLLAGQEPDQRSVYWWTLAPDPQELALNLQVVQLKTSVLLERNWECEKLEAQYLRTHHQRCLRSRTDGLTGNGQRLSTQCHPGVRR